MIFENRKAYDFFEIWLDYVEDLDLAFIKELIKKYNGKLIFLFRRQNLEKIHLLLKNRLEIMDLVGKSSCLVDLDLSQEEELKHSGKVKLIASYHNYQETPSDEKLAEIIEKMRQFKPTVYKISAFCKSDLDSLRLMDLLLELRDQKHRYIILGMGEKGRMTRIAGAVLGNEFNFAPLTLSGKSASGQLTKRDLEKIIWQVKLGYSVGDPIKQSLSPVMHNGGYKYLGIADKFIHLRRRVKAENLKKFVREIRMDSTFIGASMTIPHKLEIMKYLEEIDPVAKKIGAVNTVVKVGKKIKGYNTDYLGVLNPLKKMTNLKGKKVALLGAGGAARAALYALTTSGARVTVFNRDVAKAQKLAKEFNCSFDSLAKITRVVDFDIVLNATKVGLNPEDQPLVDKKLIKPTQIIFDIVYSAKQYETKLVREARKRRARTLSGIDMLTSQAVRQFKLYTGKDIKAEVLRKTL